MHFSHSPEIWSLFPELVPGVIAVDGIHKAAQVGPFVERFGELARSRLAAAGTETELAEIQAWRRAFSRLGLKPTQYRCASESLLRRFRKDGPLPPIHPLIDLCNAASMAHAIPVAVFDATRVDQWLEVRRAQGTENYLDFAGGTEHPEAGEVIFADALGRAHARRWTHRQSGLSAVRDDTARVLIVAEALHASARADVLALTAALAHALQACWDAAPVCTLLTQAGPRFDF